MIFSVARGNHSRDEAEGGVTATVVRRLYGLVYFSSLCIFLPSLGGLVHLWVAETDGPPGTSEPDACRFAIAVTTGAGCIALLAGVGLFRRIRRRAVYGTVLLLLLFPAVLFVVEAATRAFNPGWPAVGLHGVRPDVGRNAWARAVKSDENAFNNWGQRDRNRSITAAPETHRVAFVGDSFLEESSTIPVSVRVEQLIDRANVEVINLGVSASGPDEYYYRTQNIAIPLGIQHCVVMVFSGNDFATPPRTLGTYSGVAAVYPRDSLLSRFQLRAVNHLLTNRQRPVLQAWFEAGDLSAHESNLGAKLAAADDQRMRDLLVSLAPPNLSPEQRQNLAARMNDDGMSSFFGMLRNPDKGLFRSYYLSAAVWSASVGGAQWPAQSEEPCFHWVQKISGLCRENDVRFTLVVIPEAFQVDSRMRDQWRPLANMRELTFACREAAAKLVARTQAAGIDTIDLHEALEGIEGTYLNLDGHWSDRGVEIAAQTLLRGLKLPLPENSDPQEPSSERHHVANRE